MCVSVYLSVNSCLSFVDRKMFPVSGKETLPDAVQSYCNRVPLMVLLV